MLSSCSQTKWIGASQEEESRIRERERDREAKKNKLIMGELRKRRAC